jgi:hypothetical protein
MLLSATHARNETPWNIVPPNGDDDNVFTGFHVMRVKTRTDFVAFSRIYGGSARLVAGGVF